MNDSVMEEKNGNKKSKKPLFIIGGILVVTLVVVILILTLGKSSKSSGGPGGMRGMPGGMPGGRGGMGGASSTVTSVRTVKAEKAALNDFVNTNGEVETQTSIEVFPSIGGKVVELAVSLGSQVKKGDLIAYVDPSEPGSYYAKSAITAPIDGSIISSPVKPGTRVSVSSVITKIGDINNLQVSAKVPERYVSELKIGQKAEISLKAYENVVFAATVVRISPVLDASTRTKEIILNFDKPDSRINAGMFAGVKLYTTVYDGEITIQQDALVNNNDEYYLYVVNEDGQTVSKKKVTLGKNVDGYYQILSGISVGDTVVVEGMLTLSEGSRIKDITNGNTTDAEASSDKSADFSGNPGEMPQGIPSDEAAAKSGKSKSGRSSKQ